ncbi:MAG: hypothetical protein IRZ08_03230 [Frankia sp.]|nr:hypothetical protein [Frankia sp.]
MVNASIVTTVGTLIWVGLLWLALAAIFGIVLGIVAVAGSLDSSLWQSGFSGWQRIVMFAAGYTMTSAFGPILIGNGVTRSRLAGAATVTMVVLALVGGLFVALGYTLEGLVFSALDWPQELRGGQRVDGISDIVRLGFAHVGLFTCYFAAGRLVGIARGALGPDEFVLLIPPALIPPAVAELFLIHDLAGLPLIGQVNLDWVPSSWAVGLLVSLAAAAVATVIAHPASRAITLPIGRQPG